MYLSDHGVNIKAWFALSGRLREARERLRQVAAAKDHYGIHLADDTTAPSATAISATMLAESAHFLEEEVVGFSAQERQLLEWVVQDAEPRRTLVAVHGMGGVGKTTLVTHVYKQAAANTGHFDCAAWVSVSQSFTLEDLRRPLQELHRDARWGTVRSCNHAAVADYRSLVEAMRDHLSERRYLVVVDDVWDAQLWTKLRHALLDVGNSAGWSSPRVAETWPMPRRPRGP
uniref:Cc-nbs-lrr resistance protein n=1 Tax=Arundo donax TaxID=35708 RepID=A0A0A9AX40_ARUDO